MVEKPLGITVKASLAMIEAAERHGLVLATGENIRRYPTARACAWAINQKRLIGDVHLVTVQAINRQPAGLDRAPVKWRMVKLLTGGGMIMDSGAHFADMVQVLFGEPDEVCCTMQTLDDRVVQAAPIVGDVPVDVEDTWHAMLSFKSGTTVTWTYSRALYGEPVRMATYYGSAGTMVDLGFPFHPFQGGGDCVLADGTSMSSEKIQAAYLDTLKTEEKARLFPYGTTDGFAVEVWDFVNAIANNRKPEMDGYDGLRAKALCEACYESATAGRPVKFVDVLEGRVNAYQQPIDDYWGL
jgi:predicted dehydrogenase